MPVDTVNGAELGWERWGSGPPVLFCNGSGRALAEARPMLEYLAGEFELLAWDYRGFGPAVSRTGEYMMADLAGDVEGLLDLVGWDACGVVGISFGGLVAQEFAVDLNPERIERLALLCTSSGGACRAGPPIRFRICSAIPGRIGWRLASSSSTVAGTRTGSWSPQRPAW